MVVETLPAGTSGVTVVPLPGHHQPRDVGRALTGVGGRVQHVDRRRPCRRLVAGQGVPVWRRVQRRPGSVAPVADAVGAGGVDAGTEVDELLDTGRDPLLGAQRPGLRARAQAGDLVHALARARPADHGDEGVAATVEGHRVEVRGAEGHALPARGRSRRVQRPALQAATEGGRVEVGAVAGQEVAGGTRLALLAGEVVAVERGRGPRSGMTVVRPGDAVVGRTWRCRRSSPSPPRRTRCLPGRAERRRCTPPRAGPGPAASRSPRRRRSGRSPRCRRRR